MHVKETREDYEFYKLCFIGYTYTQHDTPLQHVHNIIMGMYTVGWQSRRSDSLGFLLRYDIII